MGWMSARAQWVIVAAAFASALFGAGFLVGAVLR